MPIGDISLSSNFSLFSQRPLDDRTAVADEAERLAMNVVRRYDMMVVDQQSDKLSFRLVLGTVDLDLANNGNWIPVFNANPSDFYTQAELQGDGTAAVHWNNLTDLPGSFPPSAHTHVEDDISNLDKYTTTQVDTLLTGKKDDFTENTGFNLNLGLTGGTVAEGDHTHTDLHVQNTDYQILLPAGVVSTNGTKETTPIVSINHIAVFVAPEAYIGDMKLFANNPQGAEITLNAYLCSGTVADLEKIYDLDGGGLPIEASIYSENTVLAKISQNLAPGYDAEITVAFNTSVTLGNNYYIVWTQDDIGNPVRFDSASTPTITTSSYTTENVASSYIRRTSTVEAHPYFTIDNTSAGSSVVCTLGGVIGTNIKHIDFLPQLTPPSYSEGLIWYDRITKTISWYDDITGTSIQGAQENILRAINDESFQINNGELVYISDHSGTEKLVKLAQANIAATSIGTIAMATHDIAVGTIGKFTRLGTVNDLDTQTPGFIAGQTLYLSALVKGGITSTAPTSPNFRVVIGTCAKSNLTTGQIEVQINAGGNTGDVIKIFNGAILEDHTVNVTSNGTIVTLTLDHADTISDLSLFFNGLFDVFTAPSSVTLTAGSDNAPQEGFIYIPESTRVLTYNAVGWPAEQHVPVATVVIQSATGVDNDGCYKCHAWTDHLAGSDNQGHLSHVNKWIRNRPVSWDDGVAQNTTVVINGGAIDNVYFSTTSGSAFQLHDHDFPALDMQTGSPVWVVNDFTTAYDRITDLSTIDTTSLGVTLRSNNTYYSVFIWGAVNETTADCKYYANAPTGSYSNPTDAVTDPLGFSDESIPRSFRGVGFPIAKVVLRYQTSASGTITEIATISLLESLGGGGGATIGTEFSDNLFKVFNVGDNTKVLAFDVSGVTTATTRTLVIPDLDGTILLDGSNTLTQYTTLGINGANGFEVSDGTNDHLFYVSIVDANGILLTHYGAAIQLNGTSTTENIFIGTDDSSINLATGSPLTIDSARNIDITITGTSVFTITGATSGGSGNIQEWYDIGTNLVANVNDEGSFTGNFFRAITTDFIEGSVGSAITMQNGAATGNTYSEIIALTTGDTVWGDLVLQRGGGSVGIGTSSPQVHLDIDTEAAEPTKVRINGEIGQQKRLEIRHFDASEAGLDDNMGFIASKGSNELTIGHIDESAIDIDIIILNQDGGVRIPLMKSGTSQVDAGAVVGELWADTNADNIVKIGV